VVRVFALFLESQAYKRCAQWFRGVPQFRWGSVWFVCSSVFGMVRFGHFVCTWSELLALLSTCVTLANMCVSPDGDSSG